MEGAALSDANLTNSYFSSSFIGVNGFGSPAESKYSMMQVPTESYGYQHQIYFIDSCGDRLLLVICYVMEELNKYNS